MNLEEWRRQIDAIDDQVLKLLNKRVQIALQIGQEKRAQQLPIYAPERETQIIERLLISNEGPLDNQAVRCIFESILGESRRLQEEHL
jgi:chorismate mutase